MAWLYLLAAGVIVPVGTLVWAHLCLLSYYDHSSTPTDIILNESPTRFPFTTIAANFIEIASKYIPTPWTSSAKLRIHPNGKEFALPEIRMRGPLRVAIEDEEKFRRAVALGAASDPEPDKLNPLFLFSVPGPVLALILAQKACPIQPIGAINTKNTFTSVKPALIGSAGALRSALYNRELTFEAAFGGESRPGIRRKRGLECCIDMNIFVGNEVVYKLQFWFLMFLSSSVKPIWNGIVEQAPTSHSSTLAQNEFKSSLHLTPAHPKIWAASCKDYNPIHVSPFGAKLFGFRNVIAHGNLVVALVLEQLNSVELLTKAAEEDARGQAAKMLWSGDTPFEIQVTYLRPVILPARTEISWEKGEEDVIGFTVSNGEKAYMVGTCKYVS